MIAAGCNCNLHRRIFSFFVLALVLNNALVIERVEVLVVRGGPVCLQKEALTFYFRVIIFFLAFVSQLCLGARTGVR